MHTKNDYKAIRNNSSQETGIFNGDTGTVVSVDTKDRTMLVQFDDENAPTLIPSEKLIQFDLCYATTVHKSQGGEYEGIIMGVIPSHSFMLTRNLVYTGVTRAKKWVKIVGAGDVLTRAILNDTQAIRYSRLPQRMVTLGRAMRWA
jgi:exodeoxyribonuclease V alpha subunit